MTVFFANAKLLSYYDYRSCISINHYIFRFLTVVYDIFRTIQTYCFQERLTVQMINRKSKVKNKKSMLFEAEWILECLLLHIKSPKAYKHINDSDILPISSHSTLRRLIRACHFGFPKMALEAIQMAFANKSKEEVQGVLCFDEISIMQEMSFDAKDHCFKGFAEEV